MTNTENTPRKPLACLITTAEVQAFFDGLHAEQIAQGQTRLEFPGFTRDPNAETIDYRWEQRHRIQSLGIERGWVQLGRGEFGQIVLLESSSDLDED